ncbi:MAG: hypothetical protein J6U21_04060 [Bacteroidales bacterium]|nr:hypothetical protein [Bacteroidales bacterium]MBP5681744.1 hypothetical protein [Bacteroidales bacterium]
MKKIFRMAAFMLALGSMTAGFTSCGEDDGTEDGGGDGPAVDEVIDATNFKIKANADGTITFIGDVASNAKIKTFQLTDASGNVVYDFLESNEQVKEKNKVIDENGKVTKEKVFNLTGINSDNIPVDLYTLSIKTRKAKTEVTLGEVLNYTIGASKSDAGSYLSIVNKKQMTMDGAKAEAAEVIAESSSDGYSVTGLKHASKAKNADIAAKAGKVALFQGGAAADVVKEGGVIITESGCICKVNELKNTSTGDATVVAVTIKSGNGLTVDVAGYNFSK